VILSTLDYKQINSLLEDPSYIRLARDPTDPTERKTILLLKKYRNNVPKRRHMKFRRRGITQKKAYDVQNKAKFEIKNILLLNIFFYCRPKLLRDRFENAIFLRKYSFPNII
jgi:hypothetical protein